jgi:hypothetical protein
LELETYCRSIAQLILLASKNLPQYTTHDLATTRLREIRHDEDGLGGSKRPYALADLLDEVLAQLVVDLVAVLDGDERVYRLARQLVRDAHHGCLGHGLVLDQRSLDLGSRQAVAGYVDHVVDASPDPVVALVVAACTVAGELGLLVWRRASISRREMRALSISRATHIISLIHIQIRVHIALVGTPDGAGHAGPGLLEGQHTLNIIPVDLLAGHGVNDGGLDAEEGERAAAGLGGSDPGKGRDDVASRLRLPVCLGGSAFFRNTIS